MMMSMMSVGKVHMTMGEWFMSMPMAVCCARRDGRMVRMLMMFVVGMLMLVLQHLMRMNMAMALSQVQPNADRHQ